MELFDTKELVTICAPMVRYSKLPFRSLVRKYGTDLAYTPMIPVDSFLSSGDARDNEFTTDPERDHPLIVQFAAKNVDDFVRASILVRPYSEGVDLNCGCPQGWALKEGFGACLIHRPEFLADLVRTTKNRVEDNDRKFSVSIKIRIHNNIADTIELCRRVEAAGVSFITVHGRTKDQRIEPVNLEAIKAIKASVKIPVVANGDVKTLSDAFAVQELTGVDGVMAARGMLENPAMFHPAGYDATPPEVIKDWLEIALKSGTLYAPFHHHLSCMFGRVLSRSERKYFNLLSSTSAVIDYVSEYLEINVDL